jgi:hypothetical protein
MGTSGVYHVAASRALPPPARFHLERQRILTGGEAASGVGEGPPRGGYRTMAAAGGLLLADGDERWLS